MSIKKEEFLRLKEFQNSKNKENKVYIEKLASLLN
jgi:hypothetical protein